MKPHTLKPTKKPLCIPNALIASDGTKGVDLPWYHPEFVKCLTTNKLDRSMNDASNRFITFGTITSATPILPTNYAAASQTILCIPFRKTAPR